MPRLRNPGRRLSVSVPVIVCAVLGILSMIPMAQGQPGSGPGLSLDEAVDARMALLAERLQLTDEQQQLVRPVIAADLTAHRDLMTEARESSSFDHQQMREEMRKIEQATDAKLVKILSTVQIDELRKLREEMKKGRGGRRRPR